MYSLINNGRHFVQPVQTTARVRRQVCILKVNANINVLYSMYLCVQYSICAKCLEQGILFYTKSSELLSRCLSPLTLIN